MAETTKHNREHKYGAGADHSHEEANGQVSFERGDVNVYQITAFGVGLLISCIVVVFAMWAMFHFLAKREDKVNGLNTPAMLKERPTLPPEPRLQGIVKPEPPSVELAQLRADEDAILNNFGWIDPAKGTVRIPISLAVDMVAAKGLPSKPTPAGADGGFRMIPLDSNSGRTFEKISQ
jgi:hypothetical protein